MKLLLLLVVVLGIAGYIYHKNPHAVQQAQTTAQTAIKTTAADIDAGTAASFKAVSADAQVYYFRNRNYGASASKSICTDVTSNGGLGDIVSAMQKVGSSVSCVTDKDYPSKSFTLTVPSLAQKGQYYCTDQNGYIGLVPSMSKAPFVLGLKCK
jgi:hypothetical protein